MRNWIKTFFSSREAYVMVNGHMSTTFRLQQGVPQGDVVSPYIFLLMVEILLIKITKTKNIIGVNYAKYEDRASGFADDCTFFIERSENNLRKTVNILNLFWEISGLKCNISKTKVIPVGVFDGENICEDLKLSWENDFTILGIEIDNKLKNLSKIFDKLYNDTRSIISRWTGYDLSFHGKITVCKTLLISQYTYVGSILDCITSDQMKLIQKQMDCFINHGKNTPKDETIKKTMD